MALPPSVVSGQSNSPQPYSQPTQFVNRGYNIPGYQTGNIIGNPSDIIEERSATGRITPDLRFPFDLPKFHFTIMEYELTGGGQLVGVQQLRKTYKMPLPLQIEESLEIQYDKNFNFLGGVAESRFGKAIQSGIGLSLNDFKTVTLVSPEFRTHSLSWKLSPKSFLEAQEIQKILHSLKKAMHPTQPAGVAIVMGFPRIFGLHFSPNPRYLFKFKPCVLSAIKVNYNGGQPVPSFYKAQSSNDQTESPPESVTIETNWIELEYIMSEDFKGGDLPTNDPYDFTRYFAGMTQVTLNPTR